MARTSRKSLFQGQPVVPVVPEAPKATVYSTYGYGRISVDGERAEDSIGSQTAIIKDYVADSSRPDLELKGVITDLGFSGTNFDRPGYAELMAGIVSGEVQCVVVKDLSRLGRTYIEVGELIFDTFPEYNVRFISVNDQYDSFADDAARKKLLILFKNLVNHMYSMDLGKKIRSAHATKQRRGELAGIPPYGYKRGDDGKTLAFDGDAAEIVQMVFDMRLAGNSTNSIAKYLTREGIPSPQNRRYQLGQVTHEKFANRIVWTTKMVSNMLQCETYTGTLVQGKYDCNGKRHTLLPKEHWVKHEDTHPAIICREKFDDVQKLMQEAAERHKIGKKAKTENPYSGKIFCSRCGKTAKRFTSGSSNGNVRFYYCCRYCNDDLKHELGLARTSNLALVMLDSIVMETLQKQMSALIDSDTLIEQLVTSDKHILRRQALLDERTGGEKVLSKADAKLSSAYAHHLDGLLDLREFELFRSSMEREKQEVTAKMARAEAELKRYDDMADRYSYWREIYAGFRAAETPTKELVQTLINRIELTPMTNEVHVVLNYDDGLGEYQGLLTESEVGIGA
jgi:DNA invertase Pin-like site-specific DNA recombinase